MLYNESLKKDYNVMLEEAIQRLKDKTELTDFSAGSIARSLLEVYYDDVNVLYEDLSLNIAKSFLSKASGTYLDEIAKLFNIKREIDESDDNYRYRINKATETLAKANEISIRLACLSVDGVHDIIHKNFVRGTGTFDIYVISDDPITPKNILNAVQEKINETQAAGVDGWAVSPRLKNIDMTLQLNFYSNTSEDDKNNIKSRTRAALREYINNIELGGELIINKIIDLIFNIDRKKIKNIKILKMFINGKEVIIGDKTLFWDERAYPKNIKIN